MNDPYEPTISLRTASEIHEERRRQDEKWGEQNHLPCTWITIITEEIGEAAEQAIKWETCEYDQECSALREYRKELIHAAAVTIAAIESIDRRLGSRS